MAKHAKWCNFMDAESHQKMNLNAFLGWIIKIYDYQHARAKFFSNFKNLPFLNFLIIIAILLHCAMGSKEKQSVLRLWHGVKQVCSLAAASWQKTRLRCELFYRLARSHIWLGRWQRKGINIQEDSIKTGSSPS